MGVATDYQDKSRPATRRIPPTLVLQLAVLAALVYVLFWGILVDMANDWWNEPAWSQGMLLPPLALYIAWINRESITRCPALGDVRGLWLTGLACLTLLLGKLSAEFFMMRIAFVILLAGLVWSFWGAGRLRMLRFPLLLLATMVPLPVTLYNSLAAPLQLFASDMATRFAQFVGISVFRDGNIIQLASISLGVEEACSGLNSLSALVVGSLLLGYVVCTKLSSRGVLVLLSIPLAIAVNVVRVAGTAIIADYDQAFAMGFYHAFSGWLVFVGGFGFLYLLAKMLHRVFD